MEREGQERMRCRCTQAGGASSSRVFALPGAKAVYTPERVVEPRRIALEVRLDFARGRVEGTARLSFRAVKAGALAIALDAVAMQIEVVRLDGKPTQHRYDGEKLRVELGERKRDDEFSIEVVYAAEPRKGLYFIRPDSAYPNRPVEAWTQGQDEDNRHWFPCLDHPSYKCPTEVSVTVPREMFALSNGELIEDITDDASGTRRFRYTLESAHASYLITLVAGSFAASGDRHGEVELSYYVNPSRVADAPRTFAHTPQMMALFEKLTGRAYPYRRYSQIAVAEFIFGGMENTSATTLTDLTLHDERAHLDISSEPLVAHELAHQWFGDLVTCRDWAHGWLNEGFATYFEHLWKEHHEGVDEADLDRLYDRAAYFEEAGGRYERPIVTRVYEEPIDLFDRHLYEKGGAVLHMLRRELGDEAFWRGINLYLERHAGGTVETADLQRALEEATGWSGGRFFEQWLYRASHPALEIAYAWDDATKVARLEVTQKLGEGVAPWELQLPVELVVGGRVERRIVAVKQPNEAFHFALSEAPIQVIVDPGQDLLAILDAKLPEPISIEVLKRGARGIDRFRAARMLGKAGSPTARPALVEALTQDPFWAVRGEAARALGELRGTASRVALSARLGEEQHPKARRHLVRALGAFRYDAEAAGPLATLLAKGDASYLVEGEAATSLGKIRAPGAYEALMAALDRPSHRDLVGAGALAGLAELRDERGIDPAIARSRYGAPVGARGAAIHALATLAAEQGARRRAAREVLSELALDDTDFRARSAAVDALHTLGDADAVDALDRVARADLDGRVRRRAREVARDLGAGRPQAEQLAALRDRTETLERARDELRDKLAALEARLPPTS